MENCKTYKYYFVKKSKKKKACLNRLLQLFKDIDLRKATGYQNPIHFDYFDTFLKQRSFSKIKKISLYSHLPRKLGLFPLVLLFGECDHFVIIHKGYSIFIRHHAES